MTGDGVIVGRARCGDTIWLLDNTRRIVEIATSTGRVVAHEMRSLRSDDQPWGLACLSDRRLWTLVTPWVLARLTGEGMLVERRPLKAPWIELFGAGDGLLFEPAPPVVASALLATSLPAALEKWRPWPGLITRATATRSALFRQNLVSCGLPNAGTIPCWFPETTDIVLSDGLGLSRHSFPWLRGAAEDVETPLHDAAFASADRVWLLAAGPRPSHGRRVAVRLVLATSSGREIVRFNLQSPVRLILAATDTACLLLTDGGDLMEVRIR